VSLPPVYLVDASVYLFRAWFSMPDDFVNGAGQPTNAVYGFSGFLCSLLEQTGAEHVAVAFDVSLASSFRNEIYPEYKANRDPAPEELKRQFDWARAVAEAMGLQCFADPRYEADDLIGTLAGYWQARGHPICVVTADKDLAQLVGKNDHWWDFSRNLKLDARQLTEKFGVEPRQMADYLALTGDAVDNIPGVPGIGPKSAAALLNHFDDLDSLFDRLDEVAGLPIRGASSLQRKLREHRPAAELARRLTGIEMAVESALAAPSLTRAEVDTAGLNRLFDELAFGGMLRQRCLRA
jgi:5'-3' exonuclease